MQVPPEPRPVCSKAPWGRKASCRSCLRWRGRALACASVPDFIIRRLHNPLSTRAPTPRSLCPRAASDGRTPGPSLLICENCGWTGSLGGSSSPATGAQGPLPPRKSSSLRAGGVVAEGTQTTFQELLFWGNQCPGGGFLPSSRAPCHFVSEEGGSGVSGVQQARL